MKKSVLLLMVAVPAILLASHGESETSRYFIQTGRESDYWPRVINFTIWIAVLYYLIANPIKSYFAGRSAGISTQLNEIEAKLQAAKDEQRKAQTRLDESDKRAAEIIADAKNEAKLLADKITEANANELAIMEKQLEEKMTLEERKSAREVIDSILTENITNEDILLDADKVVEIISKKVA